MLDHEMRLRAGASQNNGAPDFHIEGNEPFCVECICPGPGDGENKVPDIIPVNIKAITPDYKFTVSKQPTKERLLRITSAIAKKHKQYIDRIKANTVTGSDRYVIAINTDQIDSRRGTFFRDCDTGVPEILKAVYPIGDFAVEIDRNTDSVEWKHLHRAQIHNAKGRPVDTRFYFNSENNGISGILFAEMSIVEPHRAHFLFAPNPNAINPFTRNPFPWADEYRCDLDKTNDAYQLTRTPASST
jgi:hypothetical protein